MEPICDIICVIISGSQVDTSSFDMQFAGLFINSCFGTGGIISDDDHHQVGSSSLDMQFAGLFINSCIGTGGIISDVRDLGSKGLEWSPSVTSSVS